MSEIDVPDLTPLLALIDRLERESELPGLPTVARAIYRVQIGQASKLRDYLLAGDKEMVAEQDRIIQASRRLWQDHAVLTALFGIVEVDESVDPVAVIVHWELLTKELRAPAASLATELVDWYRNRSLGGRPKKNTN